MANSSLQGESYPISDVVLTKLKNALEKYGENERAKNLITQKRITYENAKRIKNFLENTDKSSAEYELAGGAEMLTFLNRILKSKRHDEHRSKEIKSDYAGNVHKKSHTRNRGIESEPIAVPKMNENFTFIVNESVIEKIKEGKLPPSRKPSKILSIDEKYYRVILKLITSLLKIDDIEAKNIIDNNLDEVCSYLNFDIGNEFNKEMAVREELLISGFINEKELKLLEKNAYKFGEKNKNNTIKYDDELKLLILDIKKDFNEKEKEIIKNCELNFLDWAHEKEIYFLYDFFHLDKDEIKNITHNDLHSFLSSIGKSVDSTRINRMITLIKERHNIYIEQLTECVKEKTIEGLIKYLKLMYLAGKHKS